MRKELIWGSCLMLLGIFIILLITLEISGPSIAPGWPTYPARLLDKFKLGLILGVLFVISRYILLGILKITHPDFRLSVLLVSYLLPILLILGAWHYYVDQMVANFFETQMPIDAIDKEVQLLKGAGFFKNQQDEPKEVVLEIALGRALVQNNGGIAASSFFEPGTRNIDHVSCLKLDTDKVWHLRGMEFEVGLTTYAQFLSALGKIAEGKFLPKAVTEDWEPDRSIVLNFENASKQHEIVLEQGKEWENVKQIVQKINLLLANADYQYYWIEDSLDVVVGLSTTEVQKLKARTHLELYK